MKAPAVGPATVPGPADMPAGDGDGGTGIGREALAGAKRARKARSAAEIRVSRGLSDCMTYYKGAF